MGRLRPSNTGFALALGATVGVVSGTGRAVDELLKDSLWSAGAGTSPVPIAARRQDPASLRRADGFKLTPRLLDVMAREFHARYMA